VSFDAFEVTRLLARQFRDQVPELCAAFMTIADSAVDGRDAITIAQSLPPPDASTAEPSGTAGRRSWRKSSAPCPHSGPCWPTGPPALGQREAAWLRRQPCPSRGKSRSERVRLYGSSPKYRRHSRWVRFLFSRSSACFMNS
jgi:hypothetical protein